MRGLPAVEASETAHTRRWDAIILGGALPGLVGAVALGMRGVRVLVVEEESSARAYPGLREPLLLTGAGPDGVLGACLNELGIALIDRRRFETHPLAYQVAMRDARVDVGDPTRSAEELVAWGLAKREPAQDLIRALVAAAIAERDAMLDAPIVRVPRRPRSVRGRRSGGAVPARGARGLPSEISGASPALRRLLASQVRALSNLGGTDPSPEAQARLLGAAFGGSADATSSNGSLRALLRRRIESLFGEFRRLRGRFDLIAAANQPGIRAEDSREVWVGRALILNAPLDGLAAAHAQGRVPELIQTSPASHKRVSLHFRTPDATLPEGMGPRVIHASDPVRPDTGPEVVSVQVMPGTSWDDPVHLVASTVVPVDAATSDVSERIRQVLAELIPFSEDKLDPQKLPDAIWDTDRLVRDPEPGCGWPGETGIRLGGRPPVYHLDRAGIAGLGFEGDLLLGQRAGEAIANELNPGSSRRR